MTGPFIRLTIGEDPITINLAQVISLRPVERYTRDTNQPFTMTELHLMGRQTPIIVREAYDLVDAAIAAGVAYIGRETIAK